MLEFLLPGIVIISTIFYSYKKGISEHWIYLILLLIFPYFIRNNFSLILFVISSVFGWLSDWVGVKTRVWRYSRKDYPNWIGLSWGYTIVLIYIVTQALSINPLIALLFSLSIVILIDKVVLSNTSKLEAHVRTLIVLLLLYYTNTMLFGAVAILMALFVEYVGCEIAKVWVYKKIKFYEISISYAGLSWFALRLVETILGINPITLLEIIFILVFVLAYGRHRSFIKKQLVKP